MGSQTTVSCSYNSSGSSSICYIRKTEILYPQTSNDQDMPDLIRPFESLRSMLHSPDFNFRSDAKIVVAGNREIPVNRRILSERNNFFKNLFYGDFVKESDGKFEMKELAKDFDVGFDALVAVLDYLYMGKEGPLPEGVCVCVDNECSHIGCQPAVNFMVEVLYTSFTFQIRELLSLYERRLLDILDKVAIEDTLIILSVANMCNKVCYKLLRKCLEIVVKSDIDVVTLDKALPYDIVKQIMDLHLELGLGEFGIDSVPAKSVKRIRRALDSNDVELVRMLLKEEHTNLDGAYALHYAVAYCDAKITMELLDLGLADVNYRNPRGYTLLHVAAMRKEPEILMSLLAKGARPSDLTPDGKKALQISKRLTRFVDYCNPIEEGKGSPKVGVEDPSTIHECQMTSFDEFMTQEIAAAPGEDFQNSFSSERPAKQLKTDRWNSCTTEAPTSSVFLTFGSSNSPSKPQQICSNLTVKPKNELISTGNIHFVSETLMSHASNSYKNQNEPKASQGTKRTTSMTRPSSHSQDHIIAERKRREKLSQRFIALSAIIPGVKQMDKATVLGDAIKYLKTLQERVKILEEPTEKKPMESVVFIKKSQLSADDDDASSSDKNSDEPLPKIEASLSDKNILIRIHCEKSKGILVKTLTEIEKLKLTVVNSSALPFGNSAMDMTIIAQMDAEFSMTVKDLVRNLRSTFRQFM